MNWQWILLICFNLTIVVQQVLAPLHLVPDLVVDLTIRVDTTLILSYYDGQNLFHRGCYCIDKWIPYLHILCFSPTSQLTGWYSKNARWRLCSILPMQCNALLTARVRICIHCILVDTVAMQLWVKTLFWKVCLHPWTNIREEAVFEFIIIRIKE